MSIQTTSPTAIKGKDERVCKKAKVDTSEDPLTKEPCCSKDVLVVREDEQGCLDLQEQQGKSKFKERKETSLTQSGPNMQMNTVSFVTTPMSSFIICSPNVSGINLCKKQYQPIHFLEPHNTDVVALQETKVSEGNVLFSANTLWASSYNINHRPQLITLLDVRFCSEKVLNMECAVAAECALKVQMQEGS